MNTFTDLINQSFRAPLFREFTDLFESRTASQRAHIDTSDAAVTLTVELPGISDESVSLKQDGRKLTLNVDAEDGASPFVDSFTETWAVAEDYELESVDAQLRDGLLTIRIPKTAPETRDIAISTSPTETKQLETSAE